MRHHRRRRLAAGPARPAQAHRRRGPGRHPSRSSTWWSSTASRRRAATSRSAMTEGRDHWYHELMADGRRRVPGRADGQRGPAVPALHLGHHRQAQGHHAHHAAATSPRSPSPTSTSSTSTPRPTSTGAPPTSAGSPATATSSTGPLANGATSVMYEGTPDTPGRDRFWAIVEKYGVTILYTAPTAIRTFMKWGTEEPDEARPLVAAAARLGGRAHQPRGVDLVPPQHRRRAAARSSTRGGRPRPAPS